MSTERKRSGGQANGLAHDGAAMGREVACPLARLRGDGLPAECQPAKDAEAAVAAVVRLGSRAGRAGACAERPAAERRRASRC